MTSHAHCLHPKTKAARAKCRRNKTEIATLVAKQEVEDQIYHDAYIAPREAQEAARKLWEAECERFCEAHIISAEQNADDTAHEEGFEPQSKRWYECAVSTLYSARDDAEQCLDIELIDKGQALDLGDHYRWVDRIYYSKRGPFATLIDREGNRKKYLLVNLKMMLDAANREPIERTPELDKAYNQYISDGISDTNGHYAPLDFQAWASTLGKDLV